MKTVRFEEIYFEELLKLQIAVIHRIAANNVRKINAEAEFKSWMTANTAAIRGGKGK